jgi:hypothetical protein
MDVHARTIVANDGLRHEGRGLAVLMSDVVDHVLEHLRPVGALDQRAEQGADLALARRGDFVVVHFDRDADRFERQDHRRADVVQAVDRRHREVAALDPWTVTGSTLTFGFFATRPGGFLRKDFQGAAGHVDAPGHRIKDEEFGFRSKISGVTNAAGLQVGFGTLGDRPRIPVVAAAIGRINHVTGEDERRLIEERINVRGARIGHQLHVRSLNAFPAGDRRTIESVAVLELVFVESADRHGHVLFLATGVCETKVDELRLVFLDHIDDVLRACHCGVS